MMNARFNDILKRINNPLQFKHELAGDDKLILFLVSITYSLLSGSVHTSNKERVCLRKFKALLLKFGAPDATMKEKKNIIRGVSARKISAAIKAVITVARKKSS